MTLDTQTKTQPRTETSNQTKDQTGHQIGSPKRDDERVLGLSTAQVAGSALAAMSGAFVVSRAGTAGTLIGAAVASVVATIGAATYTWSLKRTGDAVRRTAAQVSGAGPSTLALEQPDSVDPQGASTSEAADEPAADDTGTSRRFDLPWPKLVLASLAVMVLGMAGITAVETLTGKPIGSLLGRDDATGTTVGLVVGADDSSSSQQHSAPTNETDSTAEPTEEQSSHEPAPEQPAPSTTPTPSAPHPTPSTEPETPVVPEDGDAADPDTTFPGSTSQDDTRP